ncbi:MAG: hypothetical protein IKJ39_10765 [Lachnospiraceae bacterium]|nr:hypothetical protein [Lachnospiraceae bacterium]
MPIPFLFIGIAAVSGATGLGATAKAGVDYSKAKNLNNVANSRIENAVARLDILRKQCGDSLNDLGEAKLFILNHSINNFLREFGKIKNVDFTESEGIMEIKKLRIDQKEFAELAEMTKFSLSLVQGGALGATGGALAAFGAYSAATTFATASTGTAIASLSGAAASNATLAFFGGGSLATGGLGMAGGTAVLGGLVAGPALLVMGILTSAKAGKNLQEAYANVAKAEETCAELEIGAQQCIAIRRRCYMYYNLLARLDSYLYSLQNRMEEIIVEEGTNYATYKTESKKSIVAIVSVVGSIKAVLDTTILTEEGALTEESQKVLEQLSNN